MDFGQFNSRGASDEGRPYHLLHPVTGEPMHDGETPCVVMVRGVEGRETQEALRQIEAARFTSDNDDGPTLDELDAGIKARAAVLLVGFKSGIHRGKAKAKAPDDVQWFLDLNRVNLNLPGMSFAEQIAKAAADRGRYLGNA